MRLVAHGASAGAAVVTDGERDHRHRPRYDEGPLRRFCPPGHAKKGWCR